MTWAINDKEFKAVIALPAPKRYKYFISRVADWEQVWTLGHEDEFVLAADDDGNRLLPLWPHEKYADACATGPWGGSIPQTIQLTELLDELLPDLLTEGHLVAVFLTPADKGIHRSPDELHHDLKAALSEIE